MTKLEKIRRAAGWSRYRAAVEAGVSYPTTRLYEHDPSAVRDERKRRRLDAVYERLRDCAERGGGHAA